MNDRLKTIVDLEKYPIHNLNSPIIKKLIERCKEELEENSCSTIPNFILPQSLEVMRSELEKQLDEVYMSKESINAYLYAKDDPSLPKDHPKRNFMNRYNGYLNSNCFQKNSEMKYLYETEELLKFVSACLGVSPIYRWADPLACHAYNVMKPEGVLPWHFDSCEFTLSLMIQKPENGGIFEYCPNIREPGNEKFDEVKKVLDGDRTRVRQLKLEQGDLQIFKGRFTLHRVTKVEGQKSRYMCIPAYVLDPWRVNTPEHSKAIYGKILPIHIERNQTRSDGLTD
ncbi:hypothetical protein IDH35_05995 [Pelagibacterales bacterium SAG-MED49]|nr:hypothetical protein [Pelagibacterales bacterium SAG-MED49]